MRTFENELETIHMRFIVWRKNAPKTELRAALQTKWILGKLLQQKLKSEKVRLFQNLN